MKKYLLALLMMTSAFANAQQKEQFKTIHGTEVDILPYMTEILWFRLGF